MKRVVIILLFCVFNILLIYAELPTISVSKATLNYCLPTTSNITINLLPGETWNGYSFEEGGTYVRIIPNSLGCDSVVTLNVNVLHGALPGKFSVSNTEKVYFAKGNLQYNAYPTGTKTHMTADGIAQGIWRFAEHQYDYISSTYNMRASERLSAWIDMFGFGTSGYEKQPYLRSKIAADYVSGEIYGTKHDWGIFNAISNGGNEPGLWFTLNKAQWEFLLTERTDAVLLKTRGTVNGKSGIILLPDDWLLPEGISMITAATDSITNTYSATEWIILERAGAVFLPSCGRLLSSGSNDLQFEYPSINYYWSSFASGTTWYYLYCDQASYTAPYITTATVATCRVVRLARWVE